MITPYVACTIFISYLGAAEGGSFSSKDVLAFLISNIGYILMLGSDICSAYGCCAKKELSKHTVLDIAFLVGAFLQSGLIFVVFFVAHAQNHNKGLALEGSSMSSLILLVPFAATLFTAFARICCILNKNPCQISTKNP